MAAASEVIMGDLAANLATFIIASLLLAFGVFFIQQVRNAIRSRITELEEDETTRLMNRQMYETTMVVTNSMFLIQSYMRGFVIHLLKITAVLTSLVGVALLLTLGFALDGNHDVHNSWDYAVFSLVAFLIGAVFACLCNLTMFRVASSSSALCALGCTEGASEGDASQGFNAAFKRMFSAATAISVSAMSLGVLAVMAAFRIAMSRFSLHSADTHEISGVIAALVLGLSSVSVMQGLQGSMVARGIDLVFERHEMDMLRRSAGALQCVGTIIGDMVNNNMLFFPVVGEAMVFYLLVIGVLVDDNTNQAFALMPMVLLTFVMVVTVVICIVLMVFVSVEDGKSIVRCARVIFVGSFLLSIPTAYLTLYWCLPDEVVQVAAVGTGMITTTVSRNQAFGMMALGGVAAVIITELSEVLSTAQFALTRGVAEYCDAGAPVAIVVATASANFTFFVSAVLIVAVVYISFTLCGFFGLTMAGLGTLLPLGPAFIISFFAQLGNNTCTMAEISRMSHEACEVADRVADRGNIVGAMAASYSAVCSFLVSFCMCAALMLYMERIELSTFSTHVAAFLLLGCATAYGVSAPVLVGIARVTTIVGPSVDAIVHRDSQRMHTNISSDDPSDPECVNDAARHALGCSAMSVFMVFAIPVAVGFIFGTDAVTAVFVGATLSSFAMSSTGAALGSSSVAVKQFVLKGGLCDASRFTQHHQASVMTASVGVPLRAVNGPAVFALTKLLGAVCIVLAPVFKQHAYVRGDGRSLR